MRRYSISGKCGTLTLGHSRLALPPTYRFKRETMNDITDNNATTSGPAQNTSRACEDDHIERVDSSWPATWSLEARPKVLYSVQPKTTTSRSGKSRYHFYFLIPEEWRNEVSEDTMVQQVFSRVYDGEYKQSLGETELEFARNQAYETVFSVIRQSRHTISPFEVRHIDQPTRFLGIDVATQWEKDHWSRFEGAIREQAEWRKARQSTH